ncbi:MAG: acyl-CoA dehydratase activase [Candidatus Subteraquimicrobiales bacterium]|nr:acyl-CoA dehydratase activase [Candidatus Subteraquimicrobiales bacterium]
MNSYLGVDVGSVSTNLVVLDEDDNVFAFIYRRTKGQPIQAVQEGLKELEAKLPLPVKIKGAGTTGSARYLSGVIIGADVVKNEITAHAVAATHIIPEVKTVLEIGGQDSKLIIIRNDVVVDFAMNTVCAAGTGSFLDHQAARLSIPIEDFGAYALQSENGAQIAGRCTVFAESDMIHKQQVGYQLKDIIYGLCQALVRNYLNNLAKGKELLPPVVFQGGVAANLGIKRAFEETLNVKVIIPEYYNVMGAIGAALLAKEAVKTKAASNFKGFATSEIDYRTRSFMCGGCSNNCEVVKIEVDETILACWGGRCGKWEIEQEDLRLVH